MKNPNDLLTKVTESLYSSLEIEKALHKSIPILKKHFPINLIHVFVVDQKSRSLRYLAEATPRCGTLIDEKIILNPSYVKELQSFGGEDIIVLENTSSPLLRMTNRHFLKLLKNPIFNEDSKFSVMVLNFNLGPSLVCGFGIVSRGTDVFKKEHKEKMEIIRKPLTGAVINLLNYRDLVKKNQKLFSEKKELEQRLKKSVKSKIIGKDKGLKRVYAMISKVASMNSPVLITGETGTGKELAALSIHEASQRKDHPMVKINCGAIPHTLIDSELFGHEKGAFTGAEKLKKGFFEQADSGTIFLDEIGELPISAQVKLLRVLQTMEFNRVGGTHPVSVDVRIVAATNRDLFDMVQEKKFREDLWFRLNVFPINIPPLRERKEDIKDLAIHFINLKSKDMNIRKEIRLRDSDLKRLEDYNWPGNVRELENIIERALILGKGESLDFENFGLAIGSEKEILSRENTGQKTLDQVIREHIENALELSGCRINGKGGAAELLGMNPSTLRSKIKKLNIKIDKKVFKNI